LSTTRFAAGNVNSSGSPVGLTSIRAAAAPGTTGSAGRSTGPSTKPMTTYRSARGPRAAVGATGSDQRHRNDPRSPRAAVWRGHRPPVMASRTTAQSGSGSSLSPPARQFGATTTTFSSISRPNGSIWAAPLADSGVQYAWLAAESVQPGRSRVPESYPPAHAPLDRRDQCGRNRADDGP
jgi:hypothetical protein